MTQILSQELADAVTSSDSRNVKVVNPNDNKVYVLVEEKLHQQAMAALHYQQTCAEIAEGLAQMEAGQGIPLEEARRQSHEFISSLRNNKDV